MTKEDKISIATWLLASVTAILILVTGIISKQSFVRITPLYISLFVALLQSRVNRIAYLLGGLNSVLYFIVYLSMKLYAIAFYSLLFSSTIQFITYFQWKRKPHGKATIFKQLKPIPLTAVIIFSFIIYFICVTLLKFSDSQFVFLDTAISLIGVIVSFLAMFSYVEYAPFMLISSFLTIVLYSLMLKETPPQITYLIFAIYNFFCQVLAVINLFKIFKEQKTYQGGALL